MNKYVALFVLTVVLWGSATMAQVPTVANNAPPDQPFPTNASEADRIEEAIKPYIEQAKKSYPQAKERFLAGLPAKHSFFITTRLRDQAGRFEQVFVAVFAIKGGNITGRIWSNVIGIKGYKAGDWYTFPESEMIDWLITRPDGSEEGNFVGNFLDEYQRKRATQPGVGADR